MKKILFSEISYVLKFTLAGTFIIVFLFIYNDLLAVFLISFALIIQGILSTISSILYLHGIKKSKSEKQNNLD